eukprot:15654369-Heterocapsa_arctica.AAC.1
MDSFARHFPQGDPPVLQYTPAMISSPGPGLTVVTSARGSEQAATGEHDQRPRASGMRSAHVFS